MNPAGTLTDHPDLARARQLGTTPQRELLVGAAALRDGGHGNLVTYSRKVFIPLTELCRDTCGDDVTYVVNRNINYTNLCTYTGVAYRRPAETISGCGEASSFSAGVARSRRVRCSTLGQVTRQQHPAVDGAIWASRDHDRSE